MPNIQDHAVEIGDLSLEQRPFDALDGLILSQLVYMPMEGFLARDDRCTIAEAWAFLRDHVDIDTLDVFQKKRYRLFETCAALKRYARWSVSGYVNEVDAEREMQFCACTYELTEGQICIAFRGTDLTLIGWKEDLNMSFMTVPSQTEAAEYVRCAAQGHDGRLLLCGHSKGGNLAVYAGACTHPSAQERIHRIYTYDGPGMDEATLNGLGYSRVSQRIESYIPQSSVVGMLLHYHPVYTVVRSTAPGILQHDAMTWQVKEGGFVHLAGIDITGRLTDEALHAWLADMEMEERRLLVDTLYQVVDAAQGELVTDLVSDWRDSASRMLEAARDLAPEVKKSVRRMLRSLFSTGADEVVSMVISSFKHRSTEEPNQAR